MKANIKKTSLIPINLEKAEEHYKAKFIGDFCVKSIDGINWCNYPVAVFYQENPPEFSPQGTGRKCSNYLGLFINAENKLMICDAQSAFEGGITGFVDEDHEFIYSRFRHDFRTSGQSFIDGGSDYIKTNVSDQLRTAYINGDHLEFRD